MSGRFSVLRIVLLILIVAALFSVGTFVGQWVLNWQGRRSGLPEGPIVGPATPSTATRVLPLEPSATVPVALSPPAASPTSTPAPTSQLSPTPAGPMSDIVSPTSTPTPSRTPTPIPPTSTPKPDPTSTTPTAVLVAIPSPEVTERLPPVGDRVSTERLFHITYPASTRSNLVQPSLLVSVLDLNGEGLAGWRVEVEGFHDLVTDPAGRVRFGDIANSGFYNVRLKGPKGEDLPDRNGTKAADVELNHHSQTYVVFQEVVTLATPTAVPPAATPGGGIWQREMVAVAIHPADPAIVVAIAKDGRAFRSINGGPPWEPINDLRSVSGMIADRNNPGTFYAGTWNGVLKSTDGGATWTAKNSGLSDVNTVVQIIAVDPMNSDVLLAGLNKGGVYKSTDGAETWFPSNQGMVSADVVALAYHPTNTAIVYAGAAAAAAPFRSLDGGSTWQLMEYHAVWGTFGVATHPAVPGSVFLSVFSDRGSVVRNNEAGQGDAAHWFSLGNRLPLELKYGPLVIAPSDTKHMYLGTGWFTYGNSNGIYYSNNGGQQWVAGQGLTAGPGGQAPYVQDIAVHPHDANIVYATTGTGLYKSVDGGQTWHMQ